jgi:glycosyltransferase involved in cell wall biosynthesis
MFGGISARRGAKVVLAALESLTPAEAARICLLLIGRQTQGDGTAHAILAARESLAAQIIARDEFIADTEIGPYHELADVVLVTHVRHIGVSVSLVHAAQARRPVLASDFGLVGELTRRYGLGTTVDTADPKALAAAIRDLVIQSRPLPIDAQRMALFAEQNSPLRYAQTLVESLPLPPVDAPVTRR